ncbi:hypothetical protein AOQ84DRAFT_375959 [Glonium stellatum]|uniref:Uncharacterized protein n=1 Tax=Glonium stellatum TaxID=574774 RepID=A0A8E2F2U8_9PEZI|nr:hypothetical protein AOQ84DRAFT_375959 [Glonium stellatum]
MGWALTPRLAGKGDAIINDGKQYEAGVFIAAERVDSKSQKLVGGQTRARPSSRAVWRAAFPIEHLDENPEAKELFDMTNGNELIVRTWLGPLTYALTPTREDLIVWIMNYDVTDNEAESWNNAIEADEVLEGIA